MHAFFSALGRFTVKFRWAIVRRLDRRDGAAVHFLPTLSSVVNNNNQDFLPKTSPRWRLPTSPSRYSASRAWRR